MARNSRRKTLLKLERLATRDDLMPWERRFVQGLHRQLRNDRAATMSFDQKQHYDCLLQRPTWINEPDPKPRRRLSPRHYHAARRRVLSERLSRPLPAGGMPAQGPPAVAVLRDPRAACAECGFVAAGCRCDR